MAQKSIALGFILLVTLSARAQTGSPKPVDKEMERVQAMVNEAKKEAEQFTKSGGQASDANNPNLKWSETLWRYRRKHSGSRSPFLQ